MGASDRSAIGLVTDQEERKSRAARAARDDASGAAEGARVLDAAALPAHFERLYRAAYGLCTCREDAEDLVQEAYARVLRRPRLLRRDDDIVYLLRVLRNIWVNELRAASARPVTTRAEEIDLIVDPRGDPCVAVLELQAIYAAIRTLPEALRETIVAVDVVGLSYKEAARALGSKEGTIMSRLYRARERVADQLEASSR
jgi:RNA polymerase sigma-70 factor (ECF subfamily)